MAEQTKKITTGKTVEELAGLIKDSFAKKTELPTNVGDLTNDKGYQTQEEVLSAINAKLGATYRAGGSVASPNFEKLTAENVGLVFDVSAAFTTDADHYVEGLNKKYPAGTNIVVVQVESAYKYDVLSGYLEKVSDPTAGNLAAVDASGNVIDSGKKPTDFVAAETGKRLMTDAEGQKLDGITESATKVDVPTTPDGSINVNGEKKQVYTLPDTVLTDSDIEDYTEDELRELLGLPAAE